MSSFEVTVKDIGPDHAGRLRVWTCEFDSPFRLKTSNPNYNYIYDKIKSEAVYKVKLKFHHFANYNELMDIEPVETRVKNGMVINICSLYLEYKSLNGYKEVVVKRSKKRFILSDEECERLQVGGCYCFEYQKKYNNMYLITKI